MPEKTSSFTGLVRATPAGTIITEWKNASDQIFYMDKIDVLDYISCLFTKASRGPYWHALNKIKAYDGLSANP